MVPKPSAEAMLKKMQQMQDQLRNDLTTEFRKQTLAALTAALALIIAFSWREPIARLATLFLEWTGIPSTGLYHEVLVALIITLWAVLALVILSRWANKYASRKRKIKLK